MKNLRHLRQSFHSTLHPHIFQIRSITYLPGYEPKEQDRRFDIVKWNKSVENDYCYSVARLEWDSKEEEFNFNSVGLRWLQAEPTPRVCQIIYRFAQLKTLEYRALDDN